MQADGPWPWTHILPATLLSFFVLIRLNQTSSSKQRCLQIPDLSGLMKPGPDVSSLVITPRVKKRLMVAKPPSRLSKGEGLVLMISARGDIRVGLAAGLSVRVLFDQHRSRLGGMSYRQFCRYVDRLRQHDQNPDLKALRTVRPAGPATPSPSPARQPTPKSSALPTLSGGKDAPETTATPKENLDGPKAAPRPRTFTRLGGIADDHKDKLI